jgi:hypothetical protein
MRLVLLFDPKNYSIRLRGLMIGVEDVEKINIKTLARLT